MLKEEKRIEIRTPLQFIPDDIASTIVIPNCTNINDKSYSKIHQDISRIQWFSIGHGGVISGDTQTFSFEPEEYNCVLRYLTKFEWKTADSFCFNQSECPMRKE